VGYETEQCTEDHFNVHCLIFRLVATDEGVDYGLANYPVDVKKFI
jgi:hypothetical protein